MSQLDQTLIVLLPEHVSYVTLSDTKNNRVPYLLAKCTTVLVHVSVSKVLRRWLGLGIGLELGSGFVLAQGLKMV